MQRTHLSRTTAYLKSWRSSARTVTFRFAGVAHSVTGAWVGDVPKSSSSPTLLDRSAVFYFTGRSRGGSINGIPSSVLRRGTKTRSPVRPTSVPLNDTYFSS